VDLTVHEKKTLYIMHNIEEIKNILLVDVTVRFKALGKAMKGLGVCT